MSKKDYILLAQAMKDSKPSKSGLAETQIKYKLVESASDKQWNNDVISLSDSLAQDNPRFNRAKFLQACGYND
jgi:hypothetical protein